MITKADVIKSLFAAAMTLSAAHVSAYTNKTYMAPRPVGQNLALESATVNGLTRHHHHDAIGGTLEVTGFYTSSQDKQGIGSYFAPFNSSSFAIANYGNNQALDSYTIINWDGISNNPVTMSFAPTEETYGFVVRYHQTLSKLSDKLFLTINVPLVTVKHAMNMKIDAMPDDIATLSNYFAGTLAPVPVDNSDARVPLTNALIDGVNSVSKPGDIDVQLGYTFINNEKTNLVGTASLVLPVGNKPQGKALWEAVAGNGGHCGLGLGGKLTSRVWGSHNKQINLTLGVDYRYLFEAVEHVTFGIKNVNFGQYQDTGIGALSADMQQTVPAANILTLDARVRPQGSFEALASLTYKHNDCSATIGYNVFRRGEGEVSLKNSWNDTQYAYSLSYVDMTSGAAFNTLATAALPQSSIDTSSIQSVIMSQKVFGEIAHTFSKRENPVVIAAGAHYEFAGTNGTVENWGINVKAGISF